MSSRDRSGIIHGKMERISDEIGIFLFFMCQEMAMFEQGVPEDQLHMAAVEYHKLSCIIQLGFIRLKNHTHSRLLPLASI